MTLKFGGNGKGGRFGCVKNRAGLLGDPYFQFVRLLNHFEGANGATSAASTVGPAVTKVGGATTVLTTTNPLWGLSSGNNVGAAAGKTGWQASAANLIAIGTDDYVIEFWFYITSYNIDACLFDLRPDTTNGNYPLIFLPTGGVVGVYFNSADRITTSGGVWVTNTRMYCALARTSGNTRLYVGTAGTAPQVGSTWVDANNYATADTCWISTGAFSANASLNGLIDEVRVTVGSGRGYTGASIPVPTAPFLDF